MIDLWPEEDSLALKLSGVFDETINPPKTAQQIVDECLELAAALRAGGKSVPVVLHRVEHQEILERLMSDNPGCAWLRERRPVGRLDDIVEHWRDCATCQIEAQAERQARRLREPLRG